jgi:hypothetical protein
VRTAVSGLPGGTHGTDKMGLPRMTDGERLARAVLMFHDRQPWTTERLDQWQDITGHRSTRKDVLDELARKIIAEGSEEHARLDRPFVDGRRRTETAPAYRPNSELSDDELRARA